MPTYNIHFFNWRACNLVAHNIFEHTFQRHLKTLMESHIYVDLSNINASCFQIHEIYKSDMWKFHRKLLQNRWKQCYFQCSLHVHQAFSHLWSRACILRPVLPLCTAVYSASSSPHQYPYKLSLKEPNRWETDRALGHNTKVDAATLYIQILWWPQWCTHVWLGNVVEE